MSTVFAAVWSVLLLAGCRNLTGRLLGVRLTVRVSLIAGGLGIAGAAVSAGTIGTGRNGIGADIAFAFTSFLIALVLASVAGLVARSRQVNFDHPSGTAAFRPLRALRARVERLRRYAQLTRIAARHDFGPLALLHRGSRSEQALGRSLRDAFQDAGGIFVKFGQVLSTRSDVLPAALASELSSLQDSVSAVSTVAVRELIERELAQPIADLFSAFEDNPLAAGSLAQVHRAVLPGGDVVAVKVQRPGIEAHVERDLRILLKLSSSAESGTAWAREAGAGALARGFAENLREELNFASEAQHLATIRQALPPGGPVRVPRPYPELTTSRVLVEEYLDGRSLKEALNPGNDFDLGGSASSLLDSFIVQFFDIGLFHADPHPGNVLLLPGGELALLDFGSVGRLDSLQQHALAQVLLAIGRRQPRLLREALLQLCTAENAVDHDALDRELARFMAQRLGAGMRAGADLIGDLVGLIVRFGLVIDPQLAGMFRAIATLEGSLRVLNPDFDLLEEMQRSASERGLGLPTSAGTAGEIGDDLLELLPVLRRIPHHLDNIGHLAGRGELTVRVRLFADLRDIEHVERLTDRLLLAFFSASVGLVSVLLLALPASALEIAGARIDQVLGYAGLTAATILGLRVLAALGRHG
jgi:ubiquinone biosynthesis protein